MIERLQTLEDRYEKLNELLSDPEVISDTNKLREYSKEQSGLQGTVEAYREYKEVTEQRDEARAMLDDNLDDDMEEMVKEELNELSQKKQELEERLKVLMLPSDPNDDKNVIMEIRGAAGGDEAALFAGDLYRMYARYAEMQGWKTEVIEAHANDVGGYKEIIFIVNGERAYSKMKFENGAHRVQRVPETESGGRIHTSTATVVVMPEAEEVEVEVHDKDIRVDTFLCS